MVTMSDYDFDAEYGVPDGEGISIEEAAARLDRSTVDVSVLQRLVERFRAGEVQPQDEQIVRRLSPEERNGLRMAADKLEAVIDDE